MQMTQRWWGPKKSRKRPNWSDGGVTRRRHWVALERFPRVNLKQKRRARTLKGKDKSSSKDELAKRISFYRDLRVETDEIKIQKSEFEVECIFLFTHKWNQFLGKNISSCFLKGPILGEPFSQFYFSSRTFVGYYRSQRKGTFSLLFSVLSQRP